MTVIEMNDEFTFKNVDDNLYNLARIWQSFDILSVSATGKAESIFKANLINPNILILMIRIRSREEFFVAKEFFKRFECILLKSHFFNDVNNFDLLGILRTEECSLNELKLMFENIRHESGLDLCDTTKIKKISRLKSFEVIQNTQGVVCPKYSNKLTDFMKNPDPKNYRIKSKTPELIIKEILKKDDFILLEEKENYFVYIKENKKFFLFRDNSYILHNEDRRESINYFRVVKKFEQTDLSQDLGDLETITTRDFRKIFFDPEVTDVFKDFLEKKTNIGIKAPMGSGKTKILIDVIEYLKSQNRKVLVITNRRSLAAQLSNIFGIDLYTDLRIKNGSVVCQFDSLLKFRNKYDHIIIDECVSVFMHAVTNLTQNDSEIVFYDILKSKKSSILFCDAFLNKYIADLIGDYRVFENPQKDNAELFEIPDKQSFFYYLRNAGRCTISCTSLEVMNEIENLLGDKKILKIWGENISQKAYDVLNSENPDYDVILFSPVITTGVNVYCKFDTHFHYDSGMSVDPLQSVQMLRRNRFADKIYYCVANRFNKKIDISDYEKRMLNNVMRSNSSFFKMNKFFETEISEYGYTRIKIEMFLDIIKSSFLGSFRFFMKENFSNEPINMPKIDFDFRPSYLEFDKTELIKMPLEERRSKYNFLTRENKLFVDELGDFVFSDDLVFTSKMDPKLKKILNSLNLL